MNNSGLMTIEEARKEFGQFYEGSHPITKIKMKCWINHSESRHRNHAKPFTFHNYTSHMNTKYYVEQINLDMINCDDLGGKYAMIVLLLGRHNRES